MLMAAFGFLFVASALYAAKLIHQKIQMNAEILEQREPEPSDRDEWAINNMRDTHLRERKNYRRVLYVALVVVFMVWIEKG